MTNKPDAVKGLKHYNDEELVAELPVSPGNDRYWRTNDKQAGPHGSLSIHMFNSAADAYVVRVYRVIHSVTLPKKVK